MKKTNNKGITLIALVITIIVLLILAGISIAMLTGENGILTKAQSAKTGTENASAKEKVQLAIMGARADDGQITVAELKTEVGYQGGTVTGDTFPVTVTMDGHEFTVDGDGNITDKNGGEDQTPPKTDGLKPGETATETKKDNYTDTNGDTATIPKDFTVSDKDGEKTIDEGLVVLGPDNSEFVWIPVETPVTDTEANGTNNKAMAIKIGDNYRGLLYEFTDSNPSTSTVRSGTTTTTSDCREPDIVSKYDNNTQYNNGLFTKESLQSEYNSMIESVIKYKGFYVGRYELGLEGTENKAVSKNASTNTNVTTTDASNSNTSSWYGLYSKCKTYEAESITSSMIWGSQYDAMMNWMAKQGKTVGTKDDTKSNKERITGKKGEDKINNIYDLYGCHYEWSLEACLSYTRVYRGGFYNQCYPPVIRISGYGDPSNPYDFYSSRLTLYIK